MRSILRRSFVAALVITAQALASCNLQEPAVTDGLDPLDPAETDSLVVLPHDPATAVNVPVAFAPPDSTISGEQVSGAVEWTASGGTIDQNGVFVASAAGTYDVRARRGGRRGRSRVTVTADGSAIVALSITPATLSLQVGQAFTFTATGLRADSSAVPAPVTWTATGGSISNAGAFTAGSTPGNYRVIAVLQGGSLADTATVSVTAAPPTVTAVEVTPASVSLAPGASQQFSAIGRLSNGGNTSVTVTWSATGGSVSGTGLYTSGSTAGTFRVVAVRQGSTMADTATVTIAVPPPTVTLQAIEVSPSSVSLGTGGTQQFSAVGRMSDGSTSSVSVNWSATGGTINGTGFYSAGSTAGSYRVIAVHQGSTRADTAAVTITPPPPTLQSIEVSPPSVTLATGATQAFTAIGRMSDGSTSAVTVNWSATGGTINGSGVYTAGSSAGTYRVIAVRQGDTRADTSTVTITPPAPTLQRIEVSPPSVTLAAGATQAFTALGRMSDGSAVAVSVNWSATGGTINGSGLFTAGSSAGTYRVIAVRQGDTRADTSTVTITAPVTLSSIEVSPASATVAQGATRQFTALGRMSDNSTQAVTVTWTATGGTITSGGLYTAGSTAGSFQVTATQQGGSLAGNAAVTVSAPPPPSGNGIVLTAHRLASGSGATVVSAGVPLAVGQLQAGAVAGVGLWRDGTEVPASIVALEGRYADGSVISLLVQYDAGTMTKGTSVGGYELRLTGSSVARVAQNTGAIRDVPDGVWALPPAHFKQRVAAVWGPLVPLSEATGNWAAMDADWAAAANRRWEVCGEQVTGTETGVSPNVEHFSSKYDQPKQRIIYWARGGDIKNFERGLRQAAVARNYQQGWQQWNNQDVLSMGMAYWWTGVASYRSTVLSMARGSMGAWMGPPSNPGYDEGRITARNMGWALQAWLLGYGGTAMGDGTTALGWLDGLAQRQVTVQQANGAWYEYSRDGGGYGANDLGYPANNQSNFMAALRSYYLSLYLEYRGPSQVAGVSNAIRRNADFLLTQYDAASRTYHYWSNWAQGDAQVSLNEMANLAVLHTVAAYRAYHDGYGSSYLTQANDPGQRRPGPACGERAGHRAAGHLRPVVVAQGLHRSLLLLPPRHGPGCGTLVEVPLGTACKTGRAHGATRCCVVRRRLTGGAQVPQM